MMLTLSSLFSMDELSSLGRFAVVPMLLKLSADELNIALLDVQSLECGYIIDLCFKTSAEPSAAFVGLNAAVWLWCSL